MAELFAYLDGFGTGGSLTRSVVIVTAPAGSSVSLASAGGYGKTRSVKTKNLLDIDAYKSKVGTQAVNGVVTWFDDGLWLQSSGSDCYTNYGPTFFTISAKPNTKYTISWDLTGSEKLTGIVYAFVYNSGNSQIGSYNAVNTAEKLTFTTPEGTAKFSFRFGVQTAGQNAMYSNIQIEEGEKTSYVRYNSCEFRNVPNGWCLVTATNGSEKAETSQFISRKDVYYFVLAFSKIPDFVFSGDSKIVDDAGNQITNPESWNSDFNIHLLTSGNIRFTSFRNLKVPFEVFLGGAGASGSKGKTGECEGSGGGGGYTATHQNITVQLNTDYPVVIGAGGLAEDKTTGNPGGETSIFGLKAAGGKPGSTANYKGTGGDGGSGAGAWNGTGGTDGANGNPSSDGNGTPGKGQGSSTKAFGEGTAYANGGHGGGTDYGGQSGQPNTCDGGSGAHSYANGPGGNGGSGIIIIRNMRG